MKAVVVAVAGLSAAGAPGNGGAAAAAAAVSRAAALGARWVAVSALAGPWPDGADLAARHGVFLLLARVTGADGPVPAVEAALWSPTGRQVARQVSVVARGGELELFPVDGWPVGILAGEDARVPELARVLQLRGARCLWCVPAPTATYSEWRELAGVWQLAQQTQCFALEASPLPGRSAVHAPCEMTPGETGFLARAESPDAAHVVAARLDPEGLAGVLQAYDLRRYLNPALYRRHFPAAFRRCLP